MSRKIQFHEILFVIGLILIFLFTLLHDWVPLGALNDLEGIRSQNTTSELIAMTALNTFFVVVVLVLALWFAGKPYPILVKIWLVAQLGGILLGAISAWWIPYFRGADAELVARYQVMFGDTHTFLPNLHGIVPNTVHVLFHTTLFLVWLLAIYISVRPAERKRDDAKQEMEMA